jgi:hypothetical protein
MIEPLDLKTVMLAFGDYEEYTPNRKKGTLVYPAPDNIYVHDEKVDVKITEKINTEAACEDERRYLNLFQVRASKIYFICKSTGIIENELSDITAIEAFYSDSFIDASNRFKTVLAETRASE